MQFILGITIFVFYSDIATTKILDCFFIDLDKITHRFSSSNGSCVLTKVSPYSPTIFL
jgi:hypothetical protein